MTGSVFRLALVLCGLSLVLLAATRLIGVPHGDAARGEVLFDGASSPYLPCIQCHEYTSIAPPMRDLAKRVQQERLAVPVNADESVEQYLAESILDPNHYVVPNYAAIMPAFGESGPYAVDRISPQDLQDLVAYLITL